MKNLLDKYVEVREEKDSLLCVGIDPERGDDSVEALMDSCLYLIEQTSDYAVAYKPNSQFVLYNLGMENLKKLTEKIRDVGCISILDHKLSDIGSSNAEAIAWIKELGFDALTASPYPGNIAETVGMAHEEGLGVFMLGLMSNPEAEWQKTASMKGKPLYQWVATEVGECGCDGMVVGATNHVTETDIRKARKLAGDDVVFLCPGVGAQGGSAENIVKNAGANVLLNVSRAIGRDINPAAKAKEYRDLINGFR